MAHCRQRVRFAATWREEFFEVPLRRFDREWLRGKPLHLSLMFGSAVGALKVQHIGPDTGQGGVVDIKLKINRMSGLTAPTSETTGRVAREPKKTELLPRSVFAAWLAS
jgi:hypothetical protein